MKYFKKELWQKMNHENKSVRVAAEKEWRDNCKKYEKEFEAAKENLSSDFVEMLLNRENFHDYVIKEISFKAARNKYVCQIVLSDGKESIRLSFINIRQYRIDISSFRNCVMGKLSWGYCEFLLLPNGSVCLSILCDFDNEIELEFQTVEVSIS